MQVMLRETVKIKRFGQLPFIPESPVHAKLFEKPG
jgi:hypothetical protein